MSEIENPAVARAFDRYPEPVKGGAMKDHRGGDKLYHLAHC